MDDDGLIIPDPDHSDYEERFVLVGASRKAKIFTIVFCLRKSETVIRIISARKATENERRKYFQRKGKQYER